MKKPFISLLLLFSGLAMLAQQIPQVTSGPVVFASPKLSSFKPGDIRIDWSPLLRNTYKNSETRLQCPEGSLPEE